MENGIHRALPNDAVADFRRDLLDQASNENVGLDLQVADNGNGTSDISWHVVPAGTDTHAQTASAPATAPGTGPAVLPKAPPGLPWDGTVPAATIQLVQRLETFRAEPYADNPGNPNSTWTIGYGCTVDGSGKKVSDATPPVTEPEAVVLLRRDLGGAANDVHACVHVPLMMREAASLISWTFNLGKSKLLISGLLVAVNAGNRAGVPAEMRKWVRQGPEQLVGLLRRRWAEAGVFIGLDPDLAYDRAWAEIKTLDDWPAFGT